MKIVFIGGTGPVGVAACRHMLMAGHDVTVAHSGEHEPPGELEVRHVHEAREFLLALNGPISQLRPDVLVDTRTKADNAAEVLKCARAGGTQRLIVVSSTDVYAQFVVGSGYDVAAHSWEGDGGRAVLPSQTLPITEDAPLREAPYPWSTPGHDNAAMERTLLALRGTESITVVRPGMIYGPGSAGREWTIVRRVVAGSHRIELPDGGAQFFARVAVDRVGRAIAAAAELAPEGFWAVNAVDPYGWTYAGLVGEIGRQLNWDWEPAVVPWGAAWHPYQSLSPYFVSDQRLREVLRVHDPDPRTALAETVEWLLAHGAEHYPDDHDKATATARGPEKARDS
jgi:nucleoside-diphosphate-sugar epimerase